MPLAISGELGSYLVSTLDKDIKLARAMARDYVESIDQQALATYLMPPEVAVELLVGRLQEDPEQTLADLKKLAAGKGIKLQEGRGGRSKAGARKTAAGKGQGARRSRSRTRKRMTPEQTAQAKETILALLQRKGWSSRAEITAAAELTSMAVYTRLMGELRRARKVIAHGSKANMVYALAGTPRPGAGPRRAKKQKKPGAGKKPAPREKSRSGRK